MSTISKIGSTSTKVLLALVVAFVGLVIAGIADTGLRHVDVVVNNIFLVEQNDSLKGQVSRLQALVVKDTAKVAVVDSLIKTSALKDSIIQLTSTQLDSIKLRLEYEKRTSLISPYNTSPYRLDSVELPDSEDY